MLPVKLLKLTAANLWTKHKLHFEATVIIFGIFAWAVIPVIKVLPLDFIWG
jgi:hypothetical protein